MPWLLPSDLVRAVLRSGLLLLVPLLVTFRQGPSPSRLLTVLSFAAAITAACLSEAWARARQRDPAALAERAFLACYLACWLPVVEALYLDQGADLRALHTAFSPARLEALLVCAVGIVPLASVLALGSTIHSARPFEPLRPGQEPPPSPWPPATRFALRQGLLSGALLWGLGQLGILPGGPLDAFRACLAGLLLSGLLYLQGLFLAAIYLCCDSAAGALVRGPSSASPEEADDPSSEDSAPSAPPSAEFVESAPSERPD